MDGVIPVFPVRPAWLQALWLVAMAHQVHEPPNLAISPGEEIWRSEIRRRLEGIDASLKRQNDKHDEVLNYVQALACSQGVAVPKKEHKYLEVKQQKTMSLKAGGSVRSLRELESKMFEEISRSHELQPLSLSAGNEDGEWGRSLSSKSLKSLSSLMPKQSPDPPEANAGAPDLDGKISPAVLSARLSNDLPGEVGDLVIPDPSELRSSKRKTVTSLRLGQMNEESQTHILGSASACSLLEDVEVDAGSKFILAMPSKLYVILGAWPDRWQSHTNK